MNSVTALLSGGEQQMVVLARTFAAKPRNIMIDEMSLGLAPVVFLRLMPVIKGIAASGIGVLLVEQFAHMALNAATDALVVTGGQVSYQGNTAAGVLIRAAEVFTECGIPKIEPVISDNAFAYRKSQAFEDAVTDLGATQKFIKPHCPWTNGKVERLNRTMATEWAYRQIFTSN